PTTRPLGHALKVDPGCRRAALQFEAVGVVPIRRVQEDLFPAGLALQVVGLGTDRAAVGDDELPEAGFTSLVSRGWRRAAGRGGPSSRRTLSRPGLPGYGRRRRSRC